MAAWNGHLDQVPNRLLTLETILVKNNDGFTPLDRGNLAQLLGIEEVKKAVGEDWWAKNLEVLRQKRELERRKEELELCDEAPEVDLF